MSKDRYATTKKVGIIGILANVFLLIIKSIIGFISGSYSMIADAINSASDILSSFITYIGGVIASTPKDEEHNYGHGKIEQIFSTFIGIIMLILSLKVLYESVMSLLNHEYYQFSWWLVIVCVITIITKFILYLYVSKKGKLFNSTLISANAQDHKNDMLLTCGTLIGVLGSTINLSWLDGAMGAIISIWIFIVGISIIIENCNILMDKSINEETKKLITDKININPSITRIDSFTSKPIGNSYIIILEVSIDGNMTVNESHDIVESLKKELLEIPDINDAIIHVNPC